MVALTRNGPPVGFGESLPYVLRHAEDSPTMSWGVSQSLYDDYRDDEDQTLRDVRYLTASERDAIYERYVWRLSGSPALLARGNPRLAFVNFAWAARPEIGPDRAHDYAQAAVGRAPDGMWGSQTIAAIDRANDVQAATAYLGLWADYYRARAGERDAYARLAALGFPRKALPLPDPAPRLVIWERRVRRAARAVGVELREDFSQTLERAA